jgi:hypothetical protein
MLEDLRNHDATPTDEEKAWITGDLGQMLVRSAALVAIATTVGIGVSHAIDASQTGTLVAQSATR